MYNLFFRAHEGATLAYVALALTVMMGVVGLSYDLGRSYILSTELQKAADAAAVAGAYQLDTQTANATVAQRVADAVAGAAITSNSNRVGKPGELGTVSIGSHQILKSIPADDDTAIGAGNAGPPYNYVEVTTVAKSNANVFARMVGHPALTTMTRSAVARKGQAICNITPLMMCSPNENNFDPADYIGKQVLLKAGSGSGAGSWAPGNWGLLDTPGGSQSTKDLGEMIGGISGLPSCIDSSSGVDTKPGNVASISTAFNVRFDMYENPQFGKADKDPRYPPAENVNKGLEGKNGGGCNKFEPTARDTRMPRDPGIDPDCSDVSCRFGDGDWDCASYWTAAHPGGEAAPSGCGTPSSISRYETYLYEISNAVIPDTTGYSPAGDDGDTSDGSSCYSGGPIPPTPTEERDRVFDRRILTVALVNCAEYNVKGNSSNVPVEMYLSVFMTEAVDKDSSDRDLFVEIVGYSQGGGGGLAPVTEREWVEVVR